MMNKLKIFVSLIISTVFVSAAFGVPTPCIEFTTDYSNAGHWSYDPTVDTFTFFQDIVVDRVHLGTTDTLVGAYVHIPTMTVSGTYILSGGIISITSLPTGGITYLTGTLGTGDLVPIGTIGAAYTAFILGDITNVTVNNVIGSSVLEEIDPYDLDFELSMNGGVKFPSYTSLIEMLEGDFTGEGNFSGAISIPEPATIALLSLGGLALMRKRRV